MGHPLWFRNDWHEQCFVNMAQKAGLVKCSDPDPYALGEAVADYRETGAALYLLATLDDRTSPTSRSTFHACWPVGTGVLASEDGSGSPLTSTIPTSTATAIYTRPWGTWTKQISSWPWKP